MSNGFTVEQAIMEIKSDIKDLNEKMDGIVKNGCAHRPDDLDRIKTLENRTWADRGIAGAVGAAVAAIGAWIKG
jgi:hypothetical protein